MDENHVISQWVAELKAGDEAAAARLWARYHRRIAGLVRKYASPSAGHDVSLVVNSVFRTVFLRARDGKFDPAPGVPGVTTQGQWEAMLFAIAFRKAARAFKQRQRHATAEWTDNDIESLASDENAAFLETEVEDVLNHVREHIRLRDPDASRVLEQRLARPEQTLQGSAAELGFSVSKIQRKLELIHGLLQRQLYAESP